jgi:hypothetical protein
LAKVYDNTGQFDASVELRIDAANERLASPHPERAVDVQETPDRKAVDVSRADPQAQAAWRQLEGKVKSVREPR